MKRWRGKGLIAGLSVAMLVGLTAACSGNNEDTAASSSGAASESATSETSAEASAGLKYPASLTYWVPMETDAAVTIKDYNEMGLYKELEKRTGTHVEFQHPPAGEAQTKDQFNLMMATGKLPDAIYTNWASNAPDKAIKDGKIIRLNELIDQYAPNLAQILKDKPNIRKLITTDEGNIYAFPLIGTDPPVYAYNGLMIRKDWLDKLNLAVPTTIDEWEKALMAFRDGDPNGNGKKDEIPYFYRQTDVESSYPFIGAYGIAPGFFQENGTVKYGPTEPAYKDYLTLMNKWYSEGLIDKDYLTSDTKIRDNKVLSDQLGALAGWAGSGLGGYMQLKKDKDPSFKLVGTPFPSLKPGEKAISKGTAVITGLGTAISASVKNPEEIAAWLDYGYGKDGSLLYNFGVEGESYKLVDGKPQYTDLILHNPKNLSVSQALSTYALQTSGGPFASDPEADRQWHSDPEQSEAMAVWADADHSKDLPGSLLSADEQAKFASIMTDLNTYNSEMTNKFIMGQEPLSKFDDYVKTLKQLGIEEAIKLNQGAYDRFTSK
ncbi:extracellular solute-binding protein [Cohnella sp. GCM10012308]|uniref:extracellular solute-binding protein n=1 Tax=Cohnella sp. GCM10012308 TaxID=3317329 RepID=UPI0036064090